ncbi:MAG: leucine-rich repeat domain-containing protein [Oscillospiraceae bacterium]|nr:leucine-rich repeat domain-containing protein [Oscillospiraceae bacterium]
MKKLSIVLLCAALLGALLTGCLLDFRPRERVDNMEFVRNDDGQGYTLVGVRNVAGEHTLTIPDELNGLPVTGIGAMAIMRSDDLRVIEFGANLVELHGWAINNNRFLQEFVVHEDNPAFTTHDGVLFSADMTRLVVYPNANTAVYVDGELQATVSYTVPEGVQTIAHAAFYHAIALHEVVLPSTLRVIETRAFHGAVHIEQLNLPEGLAHIGNDAFLRMRGLTQITIPSTVRYIGDFAFYQAENLTNITILAPYEQLTQGRRWLPETGPLSAVTPVWG